MDRNEAILVPYRVGVAEGDMLAIFDVVNAQAITRTTTVKVMYKPNVPCVPATELQLLCTH